jgi:hypothetical protein
MAGRGESCGRIRVDIVEIFVPSLIWCRSGDEIKVRIEDRLKFFEMEMPEGIKDGLISFTCGTKVQCSGPCVSNVPGLS